MAVNVKNAFIAKPMDAGTAFSFAPGAYPLPTDATTALAAGILDTDHGAVDENGFSVAPTRNSDKIKTFGGGTFVSTQTEYEEQVKITFLEDDNVNVLKSVFGAANVIVESAAKKTIYHTDDELPLMTWIIQAEYGQKSKRYVVEFARVVEVAEAKSDHKAPTQWELTLDVFQGSTGKYVIEYREDESVAVPSSATVTITGTPTGGDFTLSVGGQTTAPIAYNATAANVKSALEALSTVGAGNATVTGSAGGPYSVTLANGGTVTGNGSGLTGGTTPGVTIS